MGAQDHTSTPFHGTIFHVADLRVERPALGVGFCCCVWRLDSTFLINFSSLSLSFLFQIDSDPQCTKIVSPGEPPVSGGGIHCVGEGTDKYKLQTYSGWCQDAVEQIIERKAPSFSCVASKAIAEEASVEPNPTSTSDSKRILGRATRSSGKRCAGASISGFPNCTLPLPTLQPSLTSPWTCIPLCVADQPNLSILARRFSKTGFDLHTQCKGPNMTSCSYFSDTACTLLAPGSAEPDNVNESGEICKQDLIGWCGTVQRYLGTQFFSLVSNFGCTYTRYACIAACEPLVGNQRYFYAWQAPDGRISCLGNDTNSCWSSSFGCWVDNVYKLFAGATGRTCDNGTEGGNPGWCKDAADAFRGDRGSNCPDQITTTVIASFAPTTTVSLSTPSTPGSPGTVVPSSAVREKQSLLLFLNGLYELVLLLLITIIVL